MQCKECSEEMELKEERRFGCHDYREYECKCGRIQHEKELRDDANEFQKQYFGSDE